MNDRLFGCIEAGGTKFVVGIVAAPDDIRETARFDTISPAETIGATIAWLRDAQFRHGALSALLTHAGVAMRAAKSAGGAGHAYFDPAMVSATGKPSGTSDTI